MSYKFDSKVQNEIWQIIHDINDAWVNSNPEKIADYFHENIVISHPDFQKRGEGRESCVESYKDFCRHATVHDYKEMDPEVNVFGNTAVAVYRFEITYEIKGESFYDTGQDVFIFTSEGNKWKAVWRIVVPNSRDDQ